MSIVWAKALPTIPSTPKPQFNSLQQPRYINWDDVSDTSSDSDDDEWIGHASGVVRDRDGRMAVVVTDSRGNRVRGVSCSWVCWDRRVLTCDSVLLLRGLRHKRCLLFGLRLSCRIHFSLNCVLLYTFCHSQGVVPGLQYETYLDAGLFCISGDCCIHLLLVNAGAWCMKITSKVMGSR